MKLIKTIELTGDFTWLIDIDWSPSGDKIFFLTLMIIQVSMQYGL